METNEMIKTRAVVIAVDDGSYDVDVSLDELEELAKTAGAEVIARVIQKRSSPNYLTYVGEGKIAELADFCENENIELAVFDSELSSTQLYNIQKIINISVIDRTVLILDIFAKRAISSEGKLQVEIAQLKYSLKSTGVGILSSRSGGGIGTRGPGETKLETNRRHIRRRIEKLTEELRELEERRNLSRNRRKKTGTLVGVIVGYTNAGKSTLLNTLTGSSVCAEDKLFATLDITSRAAELPDGRQIIISDTVGLIRRLPHHLIQAFKSTLEESSNADVILHVIDGADPEAVEKTQVTEELLASLGCGGIPIINIINKKDKMPDNKIGAVPPDSSVEISAKHKLGIPELLKSVSENIPEKSRRMQLFLPYANSGFSAKIRQNGKIFKEEFLEHGIIVDALIEIKLIKEANQWIKN